MRNSENIPSLQRCIIHISLEPVCFYILFIPLVILIFCATFLHPCLHSHWFASTAHSDDEDTQKQAIETMEVIFWYIAECHLETSTPPPAQVTLLSSTMTHVMSWKSPSAMKGNCTATNDTFKQVFCSHLSPTKIRKFL